MHGVQAGLGQVVIIVRLHLVIASSCGLKDPRARAATAPDTGLQLSFDTRRPAKYWGVVVFDHWDTCFLLSGPYIAYISEAMKDGLRPYEGQAHQVDASDVVQPMNPGDALIRKYKIIVLPRTLTGGSWSMDRSCTRQVILVHTVSRLKYDTDDAQRLALLQRFRDLLRRVDKLIEKEDLARPSAGLPQLSVQFSERPQYSSTV